MGERPKPRGQAGRRKAAVRAQLATVLRIAAQNLEHTTGLLAQSGDAIPDELRAEFAARIAYYRHVLDAGTTATPSEEKLLRIVRMEEPATPLLDELEAAMDA